MRDWKMRDWKMRHKTARVERELQEWKMQDEYARAENAELENMTPIFSGGNCRTGKCGKLDRPAFSTLACWCRIFQSHSFRLCISDCPGFFDLAFSVAPITCAQRFSLGTSGKENRGGTGKPKFTWKRADKTDHNTSKFFFQFGVK